MIKFLCDDCKCPLENQDNRIGIQQMVIVDQGKMMNVSGLDFCGHKCMNSWMVKNAKFPVLLTPQPTIK